MDIDFKGKTALVTGATRGIGAAIAERLRNSGADVIALGSKDSDFRDVRNTEILAQNFVGRKIDILVNNAGINKIAPISDIELDHWLDVLNVNVTAPMIFTRACFPGMCGRGYGRIVNIGSIFGHVSRPKRSSYSASKSGITGLTKASALDGAPYGVLVNALAPGFIDTGLTRTILKQEEIDVLASSVPLGRLGTPEEIANVVCFLASEKNSFITGQVLIADGGFTSV